MNLKKMIAVILAALLLLAAVPAMAEENTAALIVDAQKLDASYTLVLNAINKEDYETACMDELPERWLKTYQKLEKE